jgi:Protein of unknown function (DUF3277)
MATYSFKDNLVTLLGPGGSVSLGDGSGTSEEGISIEPVDDIDSMMIGADGSVMHSLHANTACHVSIHLLKTSPRNQPLSFMYATQTTSGSVHGQNTLYVNNKWTNDVIACSDVAFKRAPNLTYAKEGGTVTWEFNAGKVERVLGSVSQ